MNQQLLTAGLIVALMSAGCAVAPNRANTAAPGSTAVYAVRNTGSFGTQNLQNPVKVLGERVWQGRKVFAYENPALGDLLTEPETGRWIARVKGDAPLISFDPPLGWNWPLAVGESWTRKHRFTNHATKQSVDFQGNWKVESYEDITVPAGTFKAYKVVYSDTVGTENTTWSSLELGIPVKSMSRRTAKHPAGPGTSESELVSHTIRR